MYEDIVVRLARACAHGIRQKELVNELLTGPVDVVKYLIPSGIYPKIYTNHYGSARVESSSFKNMSRRLVDNGFFFVRSNDNRTIEMRFSR